MPDTHEGNDHAGGLTTHKGRLEDCPAPECLDRLIEQQNTSCNCQKADDQYLLEIDASSVHLTHAACGKPIGEYATDALQLSKTPVTLKWTEIRDDRSGEVEDVWADLTINPVGAQQPEGEPTESTDYQVVGDWGVDGADSAADARAAVTKWLRAYPKCGAHAQQRIVRDWPDGSEFYGPWTELTEQPTRTPQ